MQDAVPAIGAGGGRIFAGVCGGDRRLRPHSNGHHQQAALKCPRCESPNTKFCYYNNYNLSQPRHFCKSCRRYWTKGGVLRNVPVGGGCRKANKLSARKDQQATETITPDSTVTAATTANNSSSSIAEPLVQAEAGLLFESGSDQPMESQQQAMDEGLTRSMLTTSSSEDLMGFSDHMNPTTTSYEDEFKADVEYYGDSTLFDLTAAADPNYWNDQSTSLNFLPKF